MAIVVAGAVSVGALAYVGYRVYLNEVDDSAIELVPPDALFYVNVYLNPSTRQKQALRDLLSHVPAADTEEEVEPLLDNVLNVVLGDLGLDFAGDVKPWLGRQVGLFVRFVNPSAPDGAALIATKDPEAAIRSARAAAERRGERLESRSYKGVTYEETSSGNTFGIVGDFLVVATTGDELEASVDALQGRSLGETKDFKDASKGLPSDRIALAYFDVDPFLDLMEGSALASAGSREQLERFFVSPAAAVAYLRDDAIVIEASAPSTGPFPGAILGDLPSSAIVAVGIDDLGTYMHQVLEIFGPLGTAFADVQLQEATGLDLQDDLLSWMGDLGFYLAPSGDVPEVALVLESLDTERSAQALEKLQIALIREGVRLEPLRLAGHEGLEIRPADEQPLVALFSGERLILASTRSAAAAAASTEETLAGDAQYRTAVDALGRGLEPGLFVRVTPVLDAITEEMGSDLSSSLRVLEPDLEPFSFIIYGSRTNGDRLTARLVIGVE